MEKLSDEGRWFVVEFPVDADISAESEASSEAVPDFWLDKDGRHVSWPPEKMNDRQVIKAIAARKCPEENWQSCDVLRVFWSYRKYRESGNSTKYTNK